MLLFMDGADHYADAQGGQKWTAYSAAVGATWGRNGNGLRLGAWPECVDFAVANKQTLIAGMAINFRDSRLTQLAMQFWQGGTLQLTIGHDANAKLIVNRGPWGGLTLLGTSVASVPIWEWGYLEAKVTIDNAVGAVEVRWNGVTMLALAGIDTQQSANAYADRVRLGQGNYTGDLNCCYADDIYIADDTAGDVDDFLGDVKVETIYPTGAGNSTDFTPSAGSNWQNVDDAAPDDDSTYNASSAAGDKDTFALSNLATASGSVKGVQVINRWRKDDAGSRTACRVLRSGGTDYDGPDAVMGGSYTFAVEMVEHNPDTGTAWDIAAVNALEAGYGVVS